MKNSKIYSSVWEQAFSCHLSERQMDHTWGWIWYLEGSREDWSICASRGEKPWLMMLRGKELLSKVNSVNTGQFSREVFFF